MEVAFVVVCVVVVVGVVVIAVAVVVVVVCRREYVRTYHDGVGDSKTNFTRRGASEYPCSNTCHGRGQHN